MPGALSLTSWKRPPYPPSTKKKRKEKKKRKNRKGSNSFYFWQLLTSKSPRQKHIYMTQNTVQMPTCVPYAESEITILAIGIKWQTSSGFLFQSAPMHVSLNTLRSYTDTVGPSSAYISIRKNARYYPCTIMPTRPETLHCYTFNNSNPQTKFSSFFFKHTKLATNKHHSWKTSDTCLLYSLLNWPQWEGFFFLFFFFAPQAHSCDWLNAGNVICGHTSCSQTNQHFLFPNQSKRSFRFHCWCVSQTG